MNTSVIWVTPDAERLLGEIARVSNPDNQKNPSVSGLIGYMLRHGHWSPFEMVNMTVEINCPRDIARQILRHASCRFQEFSQRYQTVDKLGAVVLREARMQDPNNRQSSLPCPSGDLQEEWEDYQAKVLGLAHDAYQWALDRGIAKECARVVLPEGLTPSRMYVNGSLRSWIHYWQVRSDETTQKEHREIAREIGIHLANHFPATWEALTQ